MGQHSNIIKINKGSVKLVGAGPGDPELLTLKAHNAITNADVIIYDNLVSDGVLGFAQEGTELIYVGKKRAEHTLGQSEINSLIIEKAIKGKNVVRLKGGDPLIFGRGGEELKALEFTGLKVEVIPGITAAIGSASTAQIPLTHRDIASTLIFVTGQLKKGQKQDWTGLAGPNRTLVLYMGLSTAENTSNELIRDGFKSTTSIAIIENGTCLNERRIYGRLKNLKRLIEENHIKSPALVIIGEVTSLAIDWPHYLNPPKENLLAANAN